MWDFEFTNCEAQVAQLLGAWKHTGNSEIKNCFVFPISFLTNKKMLKRPRTGIEPGSLATRATHTLFSFRRTSWFVCPKALYKENILKLLELKEIFEATKTMLWGPGQESNLDHSPPKLSTKCLPSEQTLHWICSG